MSSLVMHARQSRDTVRIVALAAAVAVNAAALIALTLPLRPSGLLMPALAVEVTAVLIDPPVVIPPPPLPEPPPLVVRPKPQPVRVVAVPAPTVVPAPVVEATMAVPVAAAMPTSAAPSNDADSDSAPIAGNGSGAMQTLAYARRTDLRYPAASLRAREQGEVLLRVLVNAQGRPERIDIARSSGHPQLDRAARESVQGWTFRPVLQNGIATAAWGLVPVSFHLDQG